MTEEVTEEETEGVTEGLRPDLTPMITLTVCRPGAAFTSEEREAHPLVELRQSCIEISG